MSAKHKRTRYLIDRTFQQSFIIKFSIIIAINMAILLGALWFLSRFQYDLLPGNAGVLLNLKTENMEQVQLEKSDKGTYTESYDGDIYIKLTSAPETYNAFSLLWVPIILLSLLNLAVVIIFSLFFSHKMAGPIHRIKQSLRDYIAGDNIKAIKLRKNDQFHELAGLINRSLKLEDRNGGREK